MQLRRAIAVLVSCAAACAFDVSGPAGVRDEDTDTEPDAGTPDGGKNTIDSGHFDAGEPDAGEPDAGWCGNGIREGAELCDGDCQTSCPPKSCHTVTLAGTAATCTARCVETRITACAHGDGCCASGCSWATDDDCTCTPKSCTVACGTIDDGCGSTKFCGACGTGQACLNNRCVTTDATGAECRNDGQCHGLLCADEATHGLPGGACTQPCAVDSDCTANGVCLTRPETMCVRKCAAASDCQAPFYACATVDTSGTKACVPVGSGSSPVGGPCGSARDCSGGTNSACLPDAAGFVDGMCVRASCRNDDDCGTGAHCGQSPWGEPFCLPNCTSDAQCRDGDYACVDMDGDARKECWLHMGTIAVGGGCRGQWDCAGGREAECLTDVQGFEGGYCTRWCDTTACPGGSVCHAGVTCLNQCATSSSTCGPGYSCQWSHSALAGVCFPEAGNVNLWP